MNRNALVTVADQAVSAAGNVTLAFVVLDRSSIEEFAGFGVVWSAFLMLQELFRAGVGEPLLVGADRTVLRRRQVIGLVLGLSAAGGALLALLASLLLTGSDARTATVLAVFLPALLVLDTVRFASFTAEQPARALLLDGVWTVAFLAATVALLVRDTAEPAAFVAVWAGTGALAVGAALLRWRDLRPVLAGWRDALGLLRPGRVFTLEILAERGAYQVSLMLTQVIASPAAGGVLHVARVLLGPANILYQATSNAVLPRATRVWRTDQGEATRIVRTGTLAAAAGAVLAVGLGVVLLSPVLDGSLGDTVRPAQLAVPVMVAAAASGLRLQPRLLLRVRGRYTQGLTLRVATSAVSVVATLLGAWLATAVTGAVWGYAAGTVVGVGIWFLALALTPAVAAGAAPPPNRVVTP